MAQALLGGRLRDIEEPFFGDLKRIIKAYEAYAQADASEAVRKDSADTILAALTGGQVALRHLRPGELLALFERLPDLCGLDKESRRGGGGPIDWDALYAHLSASFGWDFQQIDTSMTMSRLRAVFDYQKDHPPTHLLVAAYLGVRPESSGQAFIKGMIAQTKAMARKS